jgi:tetratricopeptide (TPR) repeat protein
MKIYTTVVLISIIIFNCTGCFFNPTLSEGEIKARQGDESFAAGDIDRAVKLWQESLNYQKDKGLYEKMAMALMVKNNLAEAEKWTLEGLTYFPNDVNLIFNNALINFHQEDFATAMDYLEKVLDINGYYPNAHFLKGLIYENNGDDASAKKEFVNEININPGSKGTWLKLRGLNK